jgi:hypothetical protein
MLTNGTLCRIAKTESELDSVRVLVVGRVTNFDMPGEIYIIERMDDQPFDVYGQKWQCMALTESCLIPVDQ